MTDKPLGQTWGLIDVVGAPAVDEWWWWERRWYPFPHWFQVHPALACRRAMKEKTDAK